MKYMGIEEIKQIIPHRYPFLLVDKVIDCVPNEKLVAIKNVSVNEEFFVGHFPQEKVMPGVLIVEALAQAGAVFFYLSKKTKEDKNLIYYLAKIEAKFMKPVIPGDQLRLEVKPIKMLSNVGILSAEAYVGDDLVTKAELAFSVKG
ncbi:MAG TPA: 3-hydroxyacyl-ACP dehydratase FabZ [Candidatus Omnitrophota bacterium]|nr:3-hydroxyacyl-ACP dehydratase FabZ [Candidatus Omnitrophota bacterium]